MNNCRDSQTEPAQRAVFPYMETRGSSVLVNPTRKKRDALFLRRLPYLRALASMPALSHYPERPAPFRWEDSEVIGFILGCGGVDLAEAKRIFDYANHLPRRYGGKKVIRFSPATRLWRGTGAVLQDP